MNKQAVANELVKIAELLIGRELDVFERHQKKIAIDTLRMSDMGANIMGGMTSIFPAASYRVLTRVDRLAK